MGLRFDKVSTDQWVNLGRAAGGAWVQNRAAQAGEDASRESEQTGITNPNWAYTGPGASPTTDGEGIDVVAPQTNAQAAGSGINVPQSVTYGLGVNPSSRQATAFTPDEKRQAGLRGQMDFYAARGDVDQAARIRGQLNAETIESREALRAKNEGVDRARMLERDAVDRPLFEQEQKLKMEALERSNLVGKEDATDRAFEKTMNTEIGAESLKRRTDANGDVRAHTTEDGIADLQNMIGRYSAAGKTKLAGAALQNLQAMTFARIQTQTAERGEAIDLASAALARGDLNLLKGVYNKYFHDGATITSITKDAKGGGYTFERTGSDNQPMQPFKLPSFKAVNDALLSIRGAESAYKISQDSFANDIKTRELTLREADSRRSREDPGKRLVQNAESIMGRQLTQPEREKLAGFGTQDDSKSMLTFFTDLVKKDVELGTLKSEDAAARVQTLYGQYQGAKKNAADSQARANAFKVSASTAKTPEEIEAVRQQAIKMGLTQAEMEVLVPSFKLAPAVVLAAKEQAAKAKAEKDKPRVPGGISPWSKDWVPNDPDAPKPVEHF